MQKAEELFRGKDTQQGFISKCLERMKPSATEEAIRKKIDDFVKLLTILDSIWSKARGKEYGILPTEAQVEELARVIAAGKKQWLDMGIGTLQPKWHMTFDGHLLAQIKKFGGLADKADDSIEAFHQVLKELRTRYRSITSYKTRENCIRKELRRRRSTEIQTQINKYNSTKRKQKAGTKRKAEAAARQEAARQAKKEKRDAALA